MNRAIQTLSCFFFFLLLSACSDREESAVPDDDVKAKAFAVLDTFNVGQNVYVRSLALEAESRAMWVGTSTGVLEIDLDTLTPRNIFSREHGLANEYVFAIFVDAVGNKWFGTNGGGVSRYRDGNWKTFFPMHGLADYWVYAFAQQQSGDLWIGTWAGANRYNAADEKFVTYFDELINEWVYGLGIDSRQRVWFGTEGGVSMYDGEEWREWNHDDGLGADNTANLPPSTNTGLGTRSRHDLSTLQQGQSTYNPNYVFSIHVDDKDQVWAGTWGGGVSRYDGNGWHNFTTADGLAGNIVYSIARDGDGALWFGTDNGASRFDGESWQTFNRDSGLAANHVYAIAVTANNEVWLGTLGGVTRLGQKQQSSQPRQQGDTQ